MEFKNNLGVLAILGHRRNGDDATPTLRTLRPNMRIGGPTHSAELAMANGLGTNLSGDIHFHRRIDGMHQVVFANPMGIIDKGRRHQIQSGMLVHKLVEISAAENKARDHLARKKSLAFTRNVTIDEEVFHRMVRSLATLDFYLEKNKALSQELIQLIGVKNWKTS
jgi:hypothetical protein